MGRFLVSPRFDGHESDRDRPTCSTIAIDLLSGSVGQQKPVGNVMGTSALVFELIPLQHRRSKVHEHLSLEESVWHRQIDLVLPALLRAVKTDSHTHAAIPSEDALFGLAALPGWSVVACRWHVGERGEAQSIIDAATIEAAIDLWKAKDWQTYKTQRDVLVALIRNGEGDRVSLPNMQFIYFINTHLRRLWPRLHADQRIFLAGLPPGRSTDEPVWQVATKGDFWSFPL